MFCRPLSISRLFIVFVVLYIVRWAFKTTTPPSSEIAKVTIAVDSSRLVRRALQSHSKQNELYGYRHYVATEEVVMELVKSDPQGRPREAWDRATYLTALIASELAQPEKNRSKWLFWFNADSIILNPTIPLEIFLPPENTRPELSNVHLLISRNWNGIDSSAFAVRIHPWSMTLLTTLSAYPSMLSQRLRPDENLEDNAFAWALQSHDSPLMSHAAGYNTWIEVPPRWFSGLPVNNAYTKEGDWIMSKPMTPSLFDNGRSDAVDERLEGGIYPWKVMQGDMAVHFAGLPSVRGSWLSPWLDRAEQYSPEWNNATKRIDLEAEVAAFWNETAMRLMKTWERERLEPLRESQRSMHFKRLSRQKASIEMQMPTKEDIIVLDAVSPPTAASTNVVPKQLSAQGEVKPTRDPVLDFHGANGSL